MGTRHQSCQVACTNCGARHEGPDEDGHSGDRWNNRAALDGQKTCDLLLCEFCAIPQQAPADCIPDELTQRRDPESRELVLRRSSVISDLHFCPAHASVNDRVPRPVPKKRQRIKGVP